MAPPPRAPRTWRCYPAPVSPWQKVLGCFLAVITLFEASVAAKVLRLPYPILIGILVACSVPAIFPLRALRSAPRVSLDDGELELSAPWTRRATSDMPTRFSLDRIDLASVALVEGEQPSDLALVDSLPVSSATTNSTAGWGELANGRMAHVWLTPGRPALYLPIDADLALLLAVREPLQVLDLIREHSRRVA